MPDPTNPQSYNRFSYVANNPLRHTDPTEHCIFGWPCPKPIQNIIDYFSPNSEPTTVAHTEASEYSDWYGGAYSGCQMCHAAKETPYTALNNGQMAAARDQMHEAAFMGTVAMGTGAFAGLVGGHFATTAACADGDCTDEVVTLYRAVGPRELNHIAQTGNYGSSPSQAGKYFAFTEQGVQKFANSSFNAGTNMTVTSIQVPQSFISVNGYIFNDVGGAGMSVHFSQDILPSLYRIMTTIHIAQ